MNDPDACIRACNQLLRGEISAIGTYTHVIGHCNEQRVMRTLDRIRDDHEQNANILRFHLSALGAVPDSGSGAWGNPGESGEGRLSDAAAIASLMGGEIHRIRQYESVLENPDVQEEIKARLREENLPRLREHVKSLETVTAR